MAAALIGMYASPALAQLRTSKPQRGPRAIAVVRWQTDAQGKSVPRLLPVTVLEDGKFHDGSLYRAAPRPMALEPGVVYEAQDHGELLGYFTLQGALKNNQTRQWYGVGKWQSSSSIADLDLKDRPQTAEEVRPGDKSGPVFAEPVDDRDSQKKTTIIFDEQGKPEQSGTADDGPPTLKRPKEGGLERRPQIGPSKADSPVAATEDDDPERPRLKRGTPASDTSTVPSKEAPANTAATTRPSDKPEARTEDDPNRPILRRGGSQPQKSDEASPGSTVPLRVQARGDVNAGSPSGAGGFSTRVFEAVAVSDAGDSGLRQDFRYRWRDSERDDLMAKMRVLALQEMEAFLKKTGIRTGAAAATARTSRARRTSSANPALPLTDLQVAGLDLDFNNSAELVYSGKATMATANGAKKNVYVTVVARVDLDGNPRRLFANVTSDDRLDAAPRLQFVDAVDAEGDSRAELLFRRIHDHGSEFAIYRVGADTLTEIFHGGNAE